MKVFAVVVALSLVLSAAPSFGQAQAPAQPAAPAAAQAPAPKPPVPFQDGLKYAYVQLQVVAAESAQGKAFQAKVEALREQKVKELQDKQKTLQAAQERLEKGASVLSDDARAKLQSEIERQQRDIQRTTEDAQQDIQSLGQQVQMEFEKALLPIIDKVATEKQVHFVFDAAGSGLVWADPSMDLTMEVIKALDSAGGAKPAAAASASTQKPAAVPAPAQK